MRILFAQMSAAAALAAGLLLPIQMAAAKHVSAPKGPRSDAQIEATLHAKLAKSKEAKDNFRLRIEGGVVTWEGTTQVEQHKGAATRMAKSAGAVRVVNHIVVSGREGRAHGSSHARPKGPRSDAQIEATLRAKLAKSKIGKDGLRFRVQGGVVTWEGVTHIAQHKGEATRMAKSAGAARVVNNILLSSAAGAHGGSGLKRARVEW